MFRYDEPFSCDSRDGRTDGRTDRHSDIANTALNDVERPKTAYTHITAENNADMKLQRNR